MRALTFVLTQPEAHAALPCLAATSDPVVVEALVEVLARPHAAPLAPAALALLARCDHPLVEDALIAALDSPLVTVRLPAVEALAQRGNFRAAARLTGLLQEDESWLVRRAVVRALAGHPEPARWQMLLAADDPHWRVRHALIGVLLPTPAPSPPSPLSHQGERGSKSAPAPPSPLVGEGGWGGEGEREAIRRRLAELPDHPRIAGLREYLEARWTGSSAATALVEGVPPWPFYDPDPAVLVRKLEELGEKGRRRLLDALPALLSHEADRARTLAAETLRRWGRAEYLAAAIAQLDDLRAGAQSTVAALFQRVDLDRIEETARALLHRADSSPAQLAWAIDQAGPIFPFDEEADRLQALLRSAGQHAPRVRQALARLGGRWPEVEAHLLQAMFADSDSGVQTAVLAALAERNLPLPVDAASRLMASSEPPVRVATVRAIGQHGDPGGIVQQAAGDPDARVRIAVAEELVQRAPTSHSLATLQQDIHPLVRAAALTDDRAAELIADPERESSWHVLEQAARGQKVPLWHLEPQPPWQPPERIVLPAEPLAVLPAAPPHARTLGPKKLIVPPVGISGHYGLPVEGFVRAVEEGVNLLFWEPNYQTLTEFAARLSSGQRRQLHFLAGTFEAGGSRIRKDVERAVRNLHIDRLALFLIFWTRSWERITDEVRGTLERLQQEGLIGMPGLSTHSRTLAVEALASGWNPVMVRHSAAHRGAETQVFPHAESAHASIITFNNTCYGRLLKPQGGRPIPPAADCYRYTLSFPTVTMCLSAPATLEQLEANLQALRDPHLDDERRRELLEQGAEVYREETLFRRLVRSR
jgi:HEAT repeat protein